MAFLLAGVTGLMPTQRLPVVSSPAAAVRVASPLMVGAVALAKKEVLVKEIQAGMEDAALMFCVRSEGIPANEMNQLRMNMPEDVTIKVCKNSLVKIATLGEGFERFAAIAGELRSCVTIAAPGWLARAEVVLAGRREVGPGLGAGGVGSLTPGRGVGPAGGWGQARVPSRRKLQRAGVAWRGEVQGGAGGSPREPDPHPTARVALGPIRLSGARGRAAGPLPPHLGRGGAYPGR